MSCICAGRLSSVAAAPASLRKVYYMMLKARQAARCLFYCSRVHLKTDFPPLQQQQGHHDMLPTATMLEAALYTLRHAHLFSRVYILEHAIQASTAVWCYACPSAWRIRQAPVHNVIPHKRLICFVDACPVKQICCLPCESIKIHIQDEAVRQLTLQQQCRNCAVTHNRYLTHT